MRSDLERAGPPEESNEDDISLGHLSNFWMGDQRPELGPLAHDAFQAAAAQYPDRRCLFFEGKWLKYRDVDLRSSALAQRLTAMGVGPGVAVGVMLDPSFDLVVSILSVLLAGGCYLPCDPSYPDERLAIYLQDGDATVVLTQTVHEARAQRLAKFGAQVAVVDAEAAAEAATAPPTDTSDTKPRRAGPEDPAYVIFTSGSTGRPKGVVVPHRGLQDLVPWLVERFSLGLDDVVMFTNTINFDVHINQLFPPLAVGAALVIAKPGGNLDARYVVDLMLAHEVTAFMFTVPTLAREYVQELKRRRKSKYTAMRAWGVGGEAVPADVVRQMQEVFPNLTPINSYGPTEASVVTIHHPFPRNFDSVVIGKPDPNVHAYIVDSALHPVGVGVPGELLLSGPRLALGYVNKPDLTAAAFVPNPCLDLVDTHIPAQMKPWYEIAYRTGDLVRWRADGTIDYLGRIDRQVKVSGVRIELGEVEVALSGAPGCTQGVATAVKAPSGVARLVGYVTPASAVPTEILAHCTARLLRAMVPSVVVALDSFPLLPNGKVDVAALPDPFEAARPRSRSVSPRKKGYREEDEQPADAIEAVVEAAWRRALHAEKRLKLDSDFFAEGGTSLAALRANAELQQALQLSTPPPINLVYEARTVRAAAVALRHQQAADSPASGMAFRPKREWDGNTRPLSTAQEQMWAVSSMISAEYAAAYAVPAAFRIQGPLDVGLLHAALQAVVARHESLRFRYVVHPDSSLRGTVAPAGSFRLPLRELAVRDEGASMAAALKAEAAAPFDLGAGPLVRAALLRPSAPTDVAVLCITAHHAVIDGWSIGVICKDLSAAYKAAAKGEAPDAHFPPLYAQYADFAVWQRDAAKKTARTCLNYWTEALRGAPEVLTLQSDRPRPAVPSYAGSVVQGPQLSPELIAKLRGIAVRLSVSPTALFLAAFHALLARMAAQDDVVVGVPVSERKLAELQPLVGCFVTSVAVRASVDPTDTFESLARSVHDALAGAQAHSTVSFPDLVKALGAGGGSANPLFQVMFDFLDEEEPTLALPAPLTATPLPVRDLGASQMDLTLEVSGVDGTLTAEFSTLLFDADTVLRLLESYAVLLEAAAASPQVPTAALEVLTPDRRTELAKLGCGPENARHLNGALVHQQFFAQAAEAPDAPCLLYKDATMTYAEVADAAKALAVRLRAQGVRRGSQVGVMLERSLSLVITIVAVFESGGAYLPLDPGYPPSRLIKYIEDGGPSVIIADAAEASAATAAHPNVAATFEALTATVRKPTLLLLTAEDLKSTEPPTANGHSGGAKIAAVAAGDVAAVLFTSGSTGRPKGVKLTHAGLRASINGSYIEMFNSKPGDVYALATTINFDPHLGNTLGALCSGAALAILPQGLEVEGQAMAQYCVEKRVTIAEQAPSVVALWEPALSAVADSLSLRLINMGGEALPSALVSKLERGIPGLANSLYNTYGPTEFTICSNTLLINSGSTDIHLGPPDPNVRAYVVDPTDLSRLQPVGAPGELLLSGARLAAGYIGQPELTAERFVANPFYKKGELRGEWYTKVYRTGDLVAWTAGGTLRFLGRIDRQVKVEGVRIELGEVETALSSAPGVSYAAVAMAELGHGRKALVGVVTPADVDTQAALVHCRQYVLPAAVPVGLAALQTLPLHPNGKIDTQKIIVEGVAAMTTSFKAPGASGFEEYIPPATDLEAAIQRAWMEVLGLSDEVSVGLDFFRAGGSSLLAGILTARLRSELALPLLPATMIYTAKTIRAMAAVAQEMLDKAASAAKDGSGGVNGGAGGAGGAHLSADDIVLEMLASQRIVPTKLPYWAYLVIQYVMLALTLVLLPVVWGALLSAVLTLQPKVGWWWLVPLWPALQVGAIFAYIALLVILKWTLVQRLKPGVYPLYGWMYARWITMRALQQQAGIIFLPPLRRTPLFPMLLKAMGAKVENVWDTIVDSTQVFDHDLITIGAGACIYHQALVTGAFVVPAGYFGPSPVLVMSNTVIGKKCHLGYKAAVTAGSVIPDFHNLKPHASRTHPGDAPVAGPLSDHPHFTPEEHLPLALSALGGLFNQALTSLKEIPSLALSMFLITRILGSTPVLFGGDASMREVVIFSVLFTVFFSWLNPNVSMWLHAGIVVAWKWCAVGRMRPGRDLTATKRGLLAYAILRRMVEDPVMIALQDLLSGTVAMAAIYRALGAKIGKQVFLGGVTVVEFDALDLEDYVSFGSDSHMFAADATGVVLPIKVRKEATAGNSAVLFCGAEVQQRSVIGNDTIVCAHRVVPPDVRLQGGIQYRVEKAGGGKSLDDAEEGLGLPQVVTESARGVVPANLPWYHSVKIAVVLMVVGPITQIAMWVPLSTAASAAAEVGWWLVPFVYVPVVGLGALCAVGWLRLLLEATGMPKLWEQGSASVYDLRVQIIHAYFYGNKAGLDVFKGTPFSVLIHRLLGFNIGRGVVLLGTDTPESKLITVGANSVVECGAMLDGHYLEFQRFIYHKMTLEERCWVQEGTRLMPAAMMKKDSRVLPASMVLPGDVLEERMVWSGMPAEPVAQRPDPEGGNKARRRLTRSSRLSSKARRSAALVTGATGFLGRLDNTGKWS